MSKQNIPSAVYLREKYFGDDYKEMLEEYLQYPIRRATIAYPHEGVPYAVYLMEKYFNVDEEWPRPIRRLATGGAIAATAMCANNAHNPQQSTTTPTTAVATRDTTYPELSNRKYYSNVEHPDSLKSGTVGNTRVKFQRPNQGQVLGSKMKHSNIIRKHNNVTIAGPDRKDPFIVNHERGHTLHTRKDGERDREGAEYTADSFAVSKMGWDAKRYKHHLKYLGQTHPHYKDLADNGYDSTKYPGNYHYRARGRLLTDLENKEASP